MQHAGARAMRPPELGERREVTGSQVPALGGRGIGAEQVFKYLAREGRR